MDGDIADMQAPFRSLRSRYGASLVVDEAHATAVHGPGGAGIVAEAGLTQEVLAVVHTCGKALASAGGFVCGSRILRDFLINHARTLIFSTAMPPYMAGQIRAALRLAKGMDRERELLLKQFTGTGGSAERGRMECFGNGFADYSGDYWLKRRRAGGGENSCRSRDSRCGRFVHRRCRWAARGCGFR